VDQAALVEALRKKEIAGTALDVFEGEPHPTLPEDFVAMKNVVLTPHFGSAVAEKRQIMSNTVAGFWTLWMENGPSRFLIRKFMNRR
jgi:phosphoglycerate dehydrogenase-like enzyme